MAHCEIQRSGVTKAQFNAACRYALRKAGLGGWADSINSDLSETSFGDHRVGASEEHPYQEICRQFPDDVQYYVSPTEEGRAQGLTGYNFIYEFTPDWDNEKTGSGYLYVSEF